MELTRLDYFYEAHKAAEQGLKCDDTTKFQEELSALGQAAESFIKLENKVARVERALESRPISFVDCRQAVDRYKVLLQDNTPLSQITLEKWWQDLVHRSCKQLERQDESLPPDADLLKQINTPLGITILNPQDPQANKALAAMLSNTISSFKFEVERRIGDVDGGLVSHRLDHLYRVEDGAITFSADESGRVSEYWQLDETSNGGRYVLERQIEADNLLRGKLIELIEALKICVEHRADYQTSLKEIQALDNGLASWLGRLANFKKDVQRVMAFTADAGLRRGRFQSIEKALSYNDQGLAQQNRGAMGTGFSGFGNHPTFLWLRDEYVAGMKERRREEERRKNYFDWYIQCQHVYDSDQLEGILSNMDASNNTEKDSHWTAFKKQARADLERNNTPIEMALAVLQEMQAHEPKDATGLQAGLAFRNPEKKNLSFEGLKILPELEAIVGQIQSMRKRLGRLQSVKGHAVVSNEWPGVVNWTEVKKQVNTLIRACELRGAAFLCRDSRVGLPPNNLFNGFWSLEKALMVIKKLPDEVGEFLSIPARRLDQERIKRLVELEQEIGENHELEEKIGILKKVADKVWSELTDALHSLGQIRWYHREKEKEKRRYFLARTALVYDSFFPDDKRWLKRQQDHPEIKEVLTGLLKQCDNLEVRNVLLGEIGQEYPNLGLVEVREYIERRRG